MSNELQAKIAEVTEKIKQSADVDEIGLNLNSISLSAANISLKKKIIKAKPINSEKHKARKKWFDTDCKRSKSNLSSIANKKHKNPQNEDLRIIYRTKLKEYKNLCESKRASFWNDKIVKLQNAISKQSFWSTWEDFDECIRHEVIALKDGNTWEQYYKKLFSTEKTEQTISTREPPMSPNDSQILNKKVDTVEVKKAIMKLKDKKSTGHDGICNEMIKASTPCLIDLLTNTFNLFLSKSQMPKLWCIGLISPINKKGSKSDPNNYRGICAGNSLLKTLCIYITVSFF